MGRKKTPQGEAVVNAIRRFPNVSKRSLARYLVQTHSDLFHNTDNEPDVEVARTLIRHYTGSLGDRSEKYAVGEMGIPPTRSIKVSPYQLGEGHWLVISDLHIPFHSQFAIERAIEFGEMEKVTGIFINGDLQDCHSLSKWTTFEKRDFNKEMEITIDFLDYLTDVFSKKKIVWKPGNHEDRLEIYYAKKAPELMNRPDSGMSEILATEKRNITYLYRNQKVMAGKLPIIHGHEIWGGSTAVNPARWLFLKAKHSGMTSHYHRTSEHQEADINGKDMVTWSIGCLCDLSPDYNPYANNWNWGFALISVESDLTYEVRNFRIHKDGKIR